MTKEEMQKQILDAVSSGAIKAPNIVLGDMVDKKIIVEEGGVGIQNNYYGNNGSKEAVEENIKDESVDEKETELGVSNKPGPRKKSLFRNAKGDKDESRSQSEAERLRSYFAQHHIKNLQFDASTNSKNNIIVAYFWKIWSEKGLVNNPESLGEGTAFHRFLTEDCELECPVEEKAFIRVIRTIINSKHIDQEIYSNVASCF